MSRMSSPFAHLSTGNRIEYFPHTSKLHCLNNKLTRHFIFSMTDRRHKALRVIWGRGRSGVGMENLGETVGCSAA